MLRDNNFRWLSRLSQNQVPSAIGQGPQVRMAQYLPVVGGLAEVLVVLLVECWVGGWRFAAMRSPASCSVRLQAEFPEAARVWG